MRGQGVGREMAVGIEEERGDDALKKLLPGDEGRGFQRHDGVVDSQKGGWVRRSGGLEGAMGSIASGSCWRRGESGLEGWRIAESKGDHVSTTRVSN